MKKRAFVLAIWMLSMALSVFAEPDTLIFHSGFEPDVAAVPAQDPTDIQGADRSLAPPNDWVKDLDNNPRIGNFNIQYQGGTPEDRIARIVPDPTDPKNHVLHYWLRNPNVPLPGENKKKGRIQANIYGNNGIFEMRQRCRLYLPQKDFEILRTWPEKMTWLTLVEYWNEPGWVKSPYPFRISINLTKDAGAGKPFYMDIHGQTMPAEKWKSIWHARNTDFPVPVGEWLTLTYDFLEGDKNTGRFVFTLERANGEKQTIFDIHDYTRHPDNPKPNGLTSWNPLKLYTSQPTVDYVRGRGGVLQVYWDDLEIFVGKNR